MSKKIPLYFFFFFAIQLMAQNKQILYNFAQTPQTLLLNPGAETNFKYHAGIPILSGFSGNIGSSGAVIADLFLNDNIDFNTKFSNVLNQLESTDDLSFNLQLDVVNLGYKINPTTYLTAGFYEEFDFIGYFPKDIATLLYEGNATYLNKRFSFSQLVFKTELLGVFHVGINKRIHKNLTLGARLKIYSSSFQLKTNQNKGTFTTIAGTNNIYKHILEDIHINLQSSGLIVNDDFLYDVQDLYKNTLLSGNLGLGIDLGFTYHVTPQFEFSGSIIDLGFINHKKANKAYTVDGTYEVEGINFQYDPNNPKDYWNTLETDFKSKITTSDNEDSYISWRSTKLNVAIKHRFGEVRLNTDCYDPAYREYYSNAIGLQLYTIFRPLQPQFALTGFFEKAFSQNFHTKVTYTIDRYSAANVGFGLSTKIGKVQFYGMVDNLFKLQELETANSMSFQLGMNLIFN